MIGPPCWRSRRRDWKLRSRRFSSGATRRRGSTTPFIARPRRRRSRSRSTTGTARSYRRLIGLEDPDLEDELRGSRQECERRLGTRCLSLAYPYGDSDTRVREAASRAGYSAATGQPARFGDAGTFSVARIGAYPPDAPLR